MKMKRSKQTMVSLLTIVAVGLIVIVWPETGQCQRSKRRAAAQATKVSDPNAADPNAPVNPNSWAGFDIILKRNIFSRTRTAYHPPTETAEAPRAAVHNPESYYLLRGISQENDQFIAFVEDVQSGTVLRLRRGDAVARGTIKTVTLDGIEYQMEDKTTVVRLGLDLEGGYGTMTTRQMVDLVTSTPGQPAPSSTTTTAPATGSGDTSDILKRLMEQRKQQLGQ